MRKDFLRRAGMGFPLGVFVGFFIAWASGGFGAVILRQEFIDRFIDLPTAIIAEVLASGLYGAACFGGMAFYEVENWSLAKATALHYLLIAVLFVPIALVMQWVASVGELLIMAAAQFVGFFLIWLIIYLRYKAQVKELNDIQNKNRKERSSK